MEDSVAATGRPAREMSINAGGDAPAQGHTDSPAQGSTQTPLFARFQRLLPGGRRDASEYGAPGQETSQARWSPPQASTANPPIPAWVTAEQQYRIQRSSFLEELTALTAPSPFYRSVYKLIEALARMPTGDAACTSFQELVAEGTPDGRHSRPAR